MVPSLIKGQVLHRFLSQQKIPGVLGGIYASNENFSGVLFDAVLFAFLYYLGHFLSSRLNANMTIKIAFCITVIVGLDCYENNSFQLGQSTREQCAEHAKRRLSSCQV